MLVSDRELVNGLRDRHLGLRQLTIYRVGRSDDHTLWKTEPCRKPELVAQYKTLTPAPKLSTIFMRGDIRSAVNLHWSSTAPPAPPANTSHLQTVTTRLPLLRYHEQFSPRPRRRWHQS